MPEETLDLGEVERPTEHKAVNESRETPLMSETRPTPESGLEHSGERYAQILTQVQTNDTGTDNEIAADAEAVGAEATAEKKVHMLVELAQVKGVAHAVRAAKRMNDLYVLDTMHDELADKLYAGLLEKGLISKE